MVFEKGSSVSAPLKRRIAFLEAKLHAEIEAHKKTFAFYRDTLHEVVILKMRNKAALEALDSDNYFEGKE